MADSLRTENPIVSVKRLDNNQVYTNLPSPSTYNWSESDVSAPDAGRTEDSVMHKKLVGRVKKLELSFQNIDTETANLVLNAFGDSEYLELTYVDPKVGTSRNGYKNTLVMYAGDRTANLYSWFKGYWTVSFNLIDRNGAK